MPGEDGCPHCNNDSGLAVIRKFLSVLGLPATCKECGKKVNVSWKYFLGLKVPLIPK